MDEVTGWLFAVGLMVGAVSLLTFISVGLAPLFSKESAPARRGPRRRR